MTEHAPWTVEPADTAFDRLVELQQTAQREGWRIANLQLPGGAFMWRRLADGEQPLDRDPALDGIEFRASRTSTANRRRGETAYPWRDWFDGEWHMAVQGRDYSCTTSGFVSTLRVKASKAGYSSSIGFVVGNEESAYSTTRDVVFFIFLPFGERRDLAEADHRFAHLTLYNNPGGV